MALAFRCLLYTSLILIALPVGADKKVAGITVADTYQLGDQVLRLNGAGVRSKLFVKVYVGALYLGETSEDAAAIIATPGAKSMQMIMLYKNVESDKITRGWSQGFEANLSDAELRALDGRLQTFNAMFPPLHRGDLVRMDYSPGTGTLLSINNAPRGHIEGEDFFRALLKVWIGDHPADQELKKGLLGD